MPAEVNGNAAIITCTADQMSLADAEAAVVNAIAGQVGAANISPSIASSSSSSSSSAGGVTKYTVTVNGKPVTVCVTNPSSSTGTPAVSGC